MEIDGNAEYRHTYYSYDIQDVEIPEQSGGGGGSGMTPEEVQQMIKDEMNKISIQPVDEDTVSLNIDGNSAGEIDDVYLTGVERDDSDEDNKQVRFKLNNGKDDIVVSVDEFSDPNIDCETF